MKTIVACVLLCTLSVVYGHNWLISPTSRNNGQALETTSVCDPYSGTKTRTKAFIGKPLSVTWTNNHQGGTFTLGIVPAGEENNFATQTTSSPSFLKTLQPNAGAGTGQTQSTTITVPTTPGNYTLQWKWSPDWVNCADLAVSYPIPTGGTKQPDGVTYTLADGHGTYNIMTGKTVCDSGYSAKNDTTGNPTCTKSSAGSLSGGAVFGIVLLVIVLVGVISVAGIMLFLKFTRPLTYVAVTKGIKHKINKIRG